MNNTGGPSYLQRAVLRSLDALGAHDVTAAKTLAQICPGSSQTPDGTRYTLRPLVTAGLVDREHRGGPDWAYWLTTAGLITARQDRGAA